MSFPDVPVDEKLFDSNELLRSYWDRATDTRQYEMPEGFLESEDLRNMTDETFSMEEIQKEDVKVVHAKTKEEKSDLVFEKAADEPPVAPPNNIISQSTLPVVEDDKNSKWVIAAFVFIFLLCFIISKLERY
jgi:hypothetical protein